MSPEEREYQTAMVVQWVWSYMVGEVRASRSMIANKARYALAVATQETVEKLQIARRGFDRVLVEVSRLHAEAVHRVEELEVRLSAMEEQEEKEQEEKDHE